MAAILADAGYGGPAFDSTHPKCRPSRSASAAISRFP